MLATVAAAAYLPAIRTTLTSLRITLAHPLVRACWQILKAAFTFLVLGLIRYFRDEIFEMLTPYERPNPDDQVDPKPPYTFPSIFRELPKDIVHELLVREMMLPRDKWVMWQYLKHPLYGWRWSRFVLDVGRFVLLPLWLSVIVIVTAYIIVLDLLCLPWNFLARLSNTA